jgi:quinol monooxygenase YgiN
LGNPFCNYEWIVDNDNDNRLIRQGMPADKSVFDNHRQTKKLLATMLPEVEFDDNE